MKYLQRFCIGWRLFLLTASLMVSVFSSAASATDYYFQTGGSLNTAGNWNTARDGSGTPAADFTTAGNTFVIQNGQAPSLSNSTAWSITGAGSGLLIETGGAMDPGNNDPALPLSMQSGANYTIPAAAASWNNLTFGTVNSASTFTVLGSGSTKPLVDLSYGNLVWRNNNNQSPQGNLNVSGTLTINNASQLRVSTGSLAETWNMAGDILVQGTSTLNFNPGNTNGSLVNLSGSLNAVKLSKSGNGSATLAFVGSTPATATWGAVTNTTWSNMAITVANTKTLTFGGGLDEGAGAFTNSGILNIGNQVLSGTGGKFTLASGATIITSNATGLDGSITVTGTKTLDPAANYEFRGAATGATLPATVNDLTINRASGDVDLQGTGTTQTVSNSLKVMSGNLNANGTRTQIQVGGNGDAVVMSGGSQINNNATVAMTGTGGVRFDTTNSGTATIAGTVDLGAATRDFNVADGGADVDMDVSGQLTNGAISKSGGGALRISAGQSFSSAATVNINGGTLRADNPTGSATGAAAIVVHGGATLGGTGAVAGSVAVNSGGHLAPGNSIESLNIGTSGATLTFNAGSNFDYEIKSNNSLAAAADLVNLTGDLSISSTAAINFADLAGMAAALLPANTKFTLIAYTGAWDNGTFASQANNSDVQIGPNEFVLQYDDLTAGVNFQSEVASGLHYVTLTAVPEASAFLCVGVAGLLAGGAVARRKLASVSSRLRS
ncbi:MAG TPA: hypothetical protein VH107_07770 [Lacipirellulaceae bacterium]|jgi:hypothetical protein|nr:hypothetical protein [Lacipirellulaceae bacterium]